MSVLSSSNWERSVARMKLITVFALAIAALAMFIRYSRTHAIGSHEDISPPFSSKHEVAIPNAERQEAPLQQAPPEQSNIANRPPIGLDNVLSASREQVIAAIQVPVHGTDVNVTFNKAKASDSGAQYEMALRYAGGEGVPQSFEDAMAWFAKAASANDANAQWKLGLGYLFGIGIPHDDSQAFTWLKRAANNGHTAAQNALSDLYFSGRGVRIDYVRAYTWANIAAGSQGAYSDRLNALPSRMTPAQIEEAKRRTSIWREHASRAAAGLSDSRRSAARNQPIE